MFIYTCVMSLFTIFHVSIYEWCLYIYVRHQVCRVQARVMSLSAKAMFLYPMRHVSIYMVYMSSGVCKYMENVCMYIWQRSRWMQATVMFPCIEGSCLSSPSNMSLYTCCMPHFSINYPSCLYTYYSNYATCKLPLHLHVPMYMYARKHQYLCI